MLLRRVTHHVRSQNWFAVFVDFVIVVVGVFVGLQVQDWSDTRKDRREETRLLNRLYDDTQTLLAAQRAELAALEARGDVLTGVNPVLFSQAPSRPLSPRECSNIAGSHSYRRPPDELPVLDEMLETGRFGLLQSEVLKAHLRSYVLLRERANAYYDEAVNELFRLHSRFPSLITVTRVPAQDSDFSWGGLSGDGFRWLPECHVDGMRENTAFLNEYADNVSRINSLTGFVARRKDHLVELEQMLAETIDAESGAQ